MMSKLSYMTSVTVTLLRNKTSNVEREDDSSPRGGLMLHG